MVPLVKELNPDLDGKARQTTIKAAWKKLPEEAKFTFVLMSRADREKALYLHKLAQIKEDLLFNGNCHLERLPIFREIDQLSDFADQGSSDDQ